MLSALDILILTIIIIMATTTNNPNVSRFTRWAFGIGLTLIMPTLGCIHFSY